MVNVFAADPPAKETPKEAPKQLHNQTICPVMGSKIDSTVYIDIQGQRVYFCCKGCPDKMKADPDKYFKKAAAEGVLFENVQTTCPVSGEKLTDKSAYTDFDGRRVYFCCKKCVGDFNKDPQKYLTAMDKPASKEVKADAKESKTN
ncbi:MAG: YHS domain-containing protein [candidate division Zixibacteria bacterium]|nr:YHS domain-containing protein [candidate division Zixibacteria bacterium]